MTHPNIRQWYRSHGMRVAMAQLMLNEAWGRNIRAVNPMMQRQAEMLGALEHASRMQEGRVFEDCRKGAVLHIELKAYLRNGTMIVWERQR